MIIRPVEEYERILAIGDIHGCFDKLMALYEKIWFNPKKDLLIFLGDYIDRGNKNIACLKFVQTKVVDEVAIALRGNHEQLMLDACMPSNSIYGGIDANMMNWYKNGGGETDKEFEGKPVELERHLDFIRKLPFSFRIGNYIFVHGGLKPNVPYEQQTPMDLIWLREECYEHYNGAETLVIGHTPTQFITGDNKPVRLQNNIVCVDTGSYADNGKITCIDVKSMKYWQS